MTDRGFAPPPDPYSPRRRTALVLTGTGTAGAYHAGVLRALHEAGVKIDVVAGRGVGALGALFAAVDGAQRLWDERGFWRGPGARRMYVWLPALRFAVLCLAAAVLVIAIPLFSVAVGLVVFPLDFALKLFGAAGIADWYVSFAQGALAPAMLPTWLPRLAVLVLAAGAATLVATGWRNRDRRRKRGAIWWRAVPSPLSAMPGIDYCWATLWDLIRGAARVKAPSRVDLARRYVELLVENLGQPGFRELFITVHDLDARRDLVFALVTEARRRDLIRRPTSQAADARRGEVFDLTALGRDHLSDALAASLALPLGTEPHPVTFPAEGFWRGETHRLCDRPGSLLRLIEELALVDVEQIVLVSAAADSPGPHALAPPRLDGHGRIGEYLQSFEVASVRDAAQLCSESGPRLYIVRPAHNPVGPLDFDGGFDDRSDRRPGLSELMGRGYEDAYHQFIEPVVGASGEQVGVRERL
jgi:predicted acylesterase/phospholipase RssA